MTQDAPEGTASGLAGVAAAAQAARAKGPPPVHLWNPAHCGEIDILIRKDGVWMHEGSPIGREALVRLFASVLRLDPDGYHLVTPVEKLRIKVEDAPFRAVRVDRDGGALRFLTDVGDEVEAGPAHALRVETDPTSGEPAPYLHVRRGLKARLTRPVFYELVEMAEPATVDGIERMAVTSHGAVFPLDPPPAG